MVIRTDSSEYNNTSVGYRPRESCFASDLSQLYHQQLFIQCIFHIVFFLKKHKINKCDEMSPDTFFVKVGLIFSDLPPSGFRITYDVTNRR